MLGPFATDATAALGPMVANQHLVQDARLPDTIPLACISDVEPVPDRTLAIKRTWNAPLFNQRNRCSRHTDQMHRNLLQRSMRNPLSAFALGSPKYHAAALPGPSSMNAESE